MPDLEGSKTYQNLNQALAAGSQVHLRFLYLAQLADIEGYPEIASNFREAAEREIEHAYGHLDYLKRVSDGDAGLPVVDTMESLKAVVALKTQAYTDKYPVMARSAREEGFDEIAEWFEKLARREKFQVGCFQQLQDRLE